MEFEVSCSFTTGEVDKVRSCDMHVNVCPQFLVCYCLLIAYMVFPFVVIVVVEITCM